MKNRFFYNDKIHMDKFVCKQHIKEVESMFKMAKHDWNYENELNIKQQTKLLDQKK